MSLESLFLAGARARLRRGRLDDARGIAGAQPRHPWRAGAGARGIQGRRAAFTGAVESHGLYVQRGWRCSDLGDRLCVERVRQRAKADRPSPGDPVGIRRPAPASAMPAAHDIIATAAAMAQAINAGEARWALAGRAMRYLGTCRPEERFGGKEIMAREGAFERTDAAMMMHPSNLNIITMPSIAIAEVEATYIGRSAHASAMPYRGLNALDAVVTAYQSIARIAPARPQHRTHPRHHHRRRHGGEHRARTRLVPVLCSRERTRTSSRR